MINRSIIWITVSLLITISSVMPIFFLQVPLRSTVTSLQLTSGNSDDLYPNLSPSGQNIVFTRSRDGDFSIWIMNSDGLHMSRLTFMAGEQTRPEFSPSGTEIAFLSTLQGNTTELWLMNASGKGQKNLGEFGVVGSFEWNPDGNSIVLDSNQNGRWSIWLIDVSSGEKNLLLKDTGIGDNIDNKDPSWSSNGDLIYFSSNRSGCYKIWSVNSEGGDLRQLSRGSSNDTRPSPSPSGEYVAYVSDAGGSPSLWLMDSNGSNAYEPRSNPLDQISPGVQWTPEVSPDSFPVWNSQSQAIMFFSENANGGSTNPNVYAYYLNVTVTEYQNQLGSSSNGAITRPGSSLVPLVHGLSDQYPCWGQDGAEIVYSAENDLGHFNLWVEYLVGGMPPTSYG